MTFCWPIRSNVTKSQSAATNVKLGQTRVGQVGQHRSGESQSPATKLFQQQLHRSTLSTATVRDFSLVVTACMSCCTCVAFLAHRSTSNNHICQHEPLRHTGRHTHINKQQRHQPTEYHTWTTQSGRHTQCLLSCVCTMSTEPHSNEGGYWWLWQQRC